MQRRAFLTTSLGFIATGAWGEATLVTPRPPVRPSRAVPRPDQIVARPSIDALVKAAKLGDGVSVVLMGPDAPLATRQGAEPRPPASVTKAVTAAYALEKLGSDYRFTTRLKAAGTVSNGVLSGDLLLCGGGDPTLDTDDLVAMAKALKTAGVQKITGRFLVWGGALPYREEIEPSQLDHLGYNPSISGLNLNFNRVHFEWRRAGANYTLAMDARTEAVRPLVKSSRISLSQRTVPVFHYEGADRWTVAQSALGKSGSRWLPVRHPALYAGDVFRTLAAAEGVVLPVAEVAETCAEGTELARHESDSLREILRGMLKYSTNLTAEVVGLAASGKDTLAGSAADMTAWVRTRFGVDMQLYDHSGLNDRNRVSAEAMVTLLAQSQAQLWPIMKHIPILDGPDYPGRVQAKTGTLNFVSSLAGYVRTQGGDTLPFAIFCADWAARERGKAAGDEQPAGSIGWNSRAKKLQDALLRRWLLLSAF